MAQPRNVTNFPTVPKDLSSIVKPEELVDIVEMSPLTLQDRRIYNILIGNAWHNITKAKRHVISRQELTKHVESNNQDIESSLRRLMASIVIIKIRNNGSGKPSTRQMQLLAENDIEDRGPITYQFPDALVKIIKDTQIFARLHTKVMFELSSKYSLALYEFLQKRVNLDYINSEIMTVDEARGLLGVSPYKLVQFGHFNNKALKPATEEVTFLTEYEVTAEPIRKGKAVTHIKWSWQKKSDIGAQISAVEELERSKTGRKARMRQKVDQYDTVSFSQKSEIKLSSTAFETAQKIAIEAGTGWDIYALEKEWRSWANTTSLENPEGAFIGFVKKKVAQTP